MTLAEFRKKVTASELLFWMAFEREYGPIGQGRDDILAAWVSMFALMPHRSEDAGPVDLNDFMPKWRPDPEPEPDEQDEKR
jgi:hypothetical protein